ncbi:acyltransferase [Halospeciosus flavus]|uniref:acyltransferase n=1 Tax=Halospeciosus flavus TaxID=3032283 RepID=UPI003617834B
MPDETTVEEHDLVTDGDVLVGGQSTVEFGVRGVNVVAGERVRFGGDIEAEGDCRLDMWCEVDGNVLVGKDAYLGERVKVDGRLVVGGDLDIGDDVNIEEGFEANGWIVIRNPMPTVVFFMAYLAHLLQLGEEEEAKELADELTAEEEHPPVRIPRSAHVSDDAWRVSTPAEIGDDCRLHGNIRAREIEVGENNNLFGSLRAQGDVHVGPETKVHGDVTTRGGDVVVDEGALVLGDVSGDNVEIREGATVDGSIRATGEMRLASDVRREPE